jgi:hypothetical protein
MEWSSTDIGQAKRKGPRCLRRLYRVVEKNFQRIGQPRGEVYLRPSGNEPNRGTRTRAMRELSGVAVEPKLSKASARSLFLQTRSNLLGWTTEPRTILLS